MSSNRSWREKIYTSNKLDNYLKRNSCPKALKESLGRQRQVQKNLKYNKLLSSNEEMAGEVVKLRESNAALKERTTKHYSEQVEAMNQLGNLRQELETTRSCLRDAETRNEQLTENRTSGQIASSAIQQILEMDKQHLKEKQRLLAAFNQNNASLTSVQISEANSSLKSDDMSNLSINPASAVTSPINTTSPLTTSPKPNQREFNSEEESEEEEYAGNFQLRKSLAANRVSMAGNSESSKQIAARRKTKRMTKAGLKRKSSMQAAENKEQEDENQRRKSSRKTVNFNFSLDESQIDDTLVDSSNITVRRKSKLVDDNSDTALTTMVEDFHNQSVEESVRVEPRENSSGEEKENTPFATPVREMAPPEVLGQRSSRRNRKQVNYTDPKGNSKMRRGDAISANSLVQSFSPTKKKKTPKPGKKTRKTVKKTVEK